MILQIPELKMDPQLDNLMENAMSCGMTAAHAT